MIDGGVGGVTNKRFRKMMVMNIIPNIWFMIIAMTDLMIVNYKENIRYCTTNFVFGSKEVILIFINTLQNQHH